MKLVKSYEGMCHACSWEEERIVREQMEAKRNMQIWYIEPNEKGINGPYVR